MIDLVIGILEVVGIIALFLGVVYLIQRSHKGDAKAQAEPFILFPVLKGNYLLAFRLSIALMMLSLVGFALTRSWLFVGLGVACFVVYAVLTWIGRLARR